MLDPINFEETVDLSETPLGAGWARVRPTEPETRECAGDGVWRTGLSAAFRTELVSAIERATDVVQVCSFLLADQSIAQAMLTAAARNVRVYVLTASEHRIGADVRNPDMVADHKRLLSSLASKVLLRSGEHIHAKFLVVDPGTPQARGWLSTTNFNKALTASVELGVELHGAPLDALAAWFRWAFWCEAERELRSGNQLFEVSRGVPGSPPRPDDATLRATLSDAHGLRDSVLELIQSAQREIIVSSYGLAADHPSVRALVSACERGVKVTLLTRPRPAVRAAVASLAAAGATVLAHDKLHAKALVVDDRALVMTANFETRGLDSGFEVGVLLSPGAAAAVRATLEEWASTFPWRYLPNAVRGDHLGDYCAADASFPDGILQIVERQAVRLPAVVAACATKLREAPRPPFAESEAGASRPCSITYTWEVRPPTLPSEARARPDSSNGVPVYDHRGRLYVLLTEPAAIERARALADSLGAQVVVR